MPVNRPLAVALAMTLLQAPLRRLGPLGDRVRAQLAKVLAVAHKTNASGNNMSQR